MFFFSAIFNHAPASEVPAIFIDEPALSDDDTQRSPTLHTKSIDLSELHDLTQLENALVDYQPFDTDDVWTLGHIVEATQHNGDVLVLIQPVKNERYSLLPKWRNLRTQAVEYAWFE